MGAVFGRHSITFFSKLWSRQMMWLSIILWSLLVTTGVFSFRSVFQYPRRVLPPAIEMVVKPVTITFQPSGKQVIAEQGAILADLAAKAGVFIPYKCKSGRCNSCELRLNGRGKCNTTNNFTVSLFCVCFQ